jgi:hypothetical protein
VFLIWHLICGYRILQCFGPVASWSCLWMSSEAIQFFYCLGSVSIYKNAGGKFGSSSFLLSRSFVLCNCSFYILLVKL